ncbi:CopY/TcrY family copper transport repressor [Levilactobacillus brevis]|uniref:CopY/TcrY family copper transport repressor n=1 Tax=Levilactobacillus brevis TaxID=1580 RepID=A0AAJ5K5U3_LEVBR|nr:CopY/TcrY family copper transport repressor [Levilactobacillus brevis]AWP45743.1 penicillinase repressor [Levilactobacillus brevis]RAY08477.1 CopY/TcrY family copper transport repressor [Levilactobacillus brevis]TOZ05549.1 CopY/TcrY family copper transport repressor [Levilactobacillus brevis]TYA98083.1 CopY/TcrY family copper transport repressor [Lactobacillus sp. SL9-6]
MSNTTLTVSISDAEWRVMRIVWTLNQADSHTIIELLERQHDWKAPTIKTLIGRLVKKGALATTKQGRQYIYTPLIDEQTAMDTALQTELDQMCAMHRGTALTHVLEQTELSQTDIQQLIGTLTQKLPQAPQMVDCDCLPADCGGSCES